MQLLILIILMKYSKNCYIRKSCRQNFEIEKCREEIVIRFIHNYENFKAETNVIIKNLSKMPIITLEDFYRQAPCSTQIIFILKQNRF